MPEKISRLTSTFFMLLLLNQVFSQSERDSMYVSVSDSSVRQVRNGIGFIPSKADGVNGWAIGWIELGANDRDSVVINGLYTNLEPFQVFWAGMIFAYTMWTPFNLKETLNNLEYFDSTYIWHGNRINGISLSVTEFSDDYHVNGLIISGVIHDLYKLNGLSVSGLIGEFSSFNGVMVSGILNNTHSGKGLQIALVNRTQAMTGIQIGLWNQIGKRKIPLINMSFKTK